MREIKFRAWDPNGMRMYERAAISKGKVEFCWNGTETKLSSFPGYSSNGVNYAAMVPLQFTGLKDKNGVEIYEGDIVEATRHKTEGWSYHGGNYQSDQVSKRREKIVFRDGTFCWGYEAFSEFTKDVNPMRLSELHEQHKTAVSDWTDFYRDFEVIGNMYEHCSMCGNRLLNGICTNCQVIEREE